MEGKRKNVYITIFVITTIVFGVVAAYFGMNYYNMKQGSQKVVASTGEILAENEEAAEKKTEVEIKEVEKYGIYKIDSSKCLNKNSENVIYSKNIFYEKIYFDISCYVSEDRKSMNISIDLDETKKYDSSINGNGKIETKCTFNKCIEKMYIGRNGNGIGDETIFCLMEDGSVEFLHIDTAIKNNNLNSFQKIDLAKEIVDFCTASVNFSDGPGGHLTTVAVNRNGNFYDLGNILVKMGVIK